MKNRFLAFIFVFASVTAFAAPRQKQQDNASDKKQYELSTLVKDLMSVQSYIDLKNYVRNIKRSKDHKHKYQGEIPLYANGERIVVENMEDNYRWKVFIGGSNAAPDYIDFSNEESTSGQPIMADYFRKAGFKLTPVACKYLGIGGESALYEVNYPGKPPVMLMIEVSMGSGGAWYSYTVYWNSKERDLPKGFTPKQCRKIDWL